MLAAARVSGHHPRRVIWHDGVDYLACRPQA
jgi:hypothetical protein